MWSDRVCTKPVGYERVDRHTFKSANLGVREKNALVHSSAALPPLTSVWTQLICCDRCVKYSTCSEGCWMTAEHPGAFILSQEEFWAAPIGYSAWQGPRFTPLLASSLLLILMSPVMTCVTSGIEATARPSFILSRWRCWSTFWIVQVLARNSKQKTVLKVDHHEEFFQII